MDLHTPQQPVRQAMMYDFQDMLIGVKTNEVWSYFIVKGDPANEFAITCARHAGKPVSLYTRNYNEVAALITTNTLVINVGQMTRAGITREDILTALRIANVYIKGVIRVGD